MWLQCSYRILGIYGWQTLKVYEIMQRMVDADLDKDFAFDSCWNYDVGREMSTGLISPPVTDWLRHNTSSLARLVRITIVSQGYVLVGSVQFWSAWFEFTIGCFLAPFGIFSLNYTTLVFIRSGRWGKNLIMLQKRYASVFALYYIVNMDDFFGWHGNFIKSCSIRNDSHLVIYKG